MNKELLLNTITKALNLAESEKEFAFRKTIEKVSEKLNYDQALRIDKLGVFQLKKEPMPRYERTQLLPSAPKEKRTLVYSPPFEKLEGDIKSLFVTLDLDDLNLTVNDDVDKVFSISVNQPLIPLSESEMAEKQVNFTNADTNVDLEQKINSLVNSATILKNYDIWDDYLNRNSKEDTANSQNDLDEIDLSDLMFNESFTKAEVNHTPDSESNNFISPLDEPLQDDLNAFETVANFDRKFENTIDEEVENLPPKISDVTSEEDLNSNQINYDEPLAGLQSLNEELKAITSDEPELSSDNDINGAAAIDEDEDIPSNLELANGFEDEIIETQSNVENQIPDDILDDGVLTKDEDLPEELQSDYDLAEENDSENDVFQDLENKLDETETTSQIAQEIIEEDQNNTAENIKEEDDNSDDEIEEEFPQEEEISEKIIEEPIPEEDSKAPQPINTDEPIYKKPVVIYGGAGLLLVIILVFLFWPSSNNEELPIQEAHQKPSQTISEESNIDNNQNEPESTLPPEDEKPKSERTGLYRNIVTDVQAANQIYFDSEVYTVQVSSWRSATIAEREVERLKNLGHDAFIYQVFLESKGSTWNRVRVGYFQTLEEAEDFLVKNKF
jgi:cell division protein FtsN/nucleoid DNA-binding protein